MKMNVIRYPERSLWPELIRRPGLETRSLESQVARIIEEVSRKGDRALLDYTREFDGIDLESLEVSDEEIRSSSDQVSDALKRAIDVAYRNIRAFHENQVVIPNPVETSTGVRCWQKAVPIERVGLYIPGGSAPLFSTVLMLGIPAKLAGCTEVILCTPPGRDGKVPASILYVAGMLGVNRIFRVGGVQAIAAMAYGTGTIPAVQKIFGPGNQYVTMAKQLVNRDKVAIDMPAGPSELAVMADQDSNPAFIASDLLSQAEHGPDSQVLLVTDSESVIGQVEKEMGKQLLALPRKEVASRALENSKAILLTDRQEMIDLINLYAPEHLIIVTRDYRDVGEHILNAGSVFLGAYTPESAGDYASGTNHTLPTNGWARAYSGVNMESFYKRITFQEISYSGLTGIGGAIMTMAEAEELKAHSNAVAIRLNLRDHG
jgi:histidinol dehydrogenase